jgi:hypothetical protein
MTDNTSELLVAIVTNLAAFRTEVQNVLVAMQGELGALRQDVQGELSALRRDVAPIQAMRAQLDGMPLLHRNLTTTQNNVRMLAAAFNDFALTNVTKGEIEILHTELNRVQAENATIVARMETAERRIGELHEAIDRRTADLKTLIDNMTARGPAGGASLTPPGSPTP